MKAITINDEIINIDFISKISDIQFFQAGYYQYIIYLNNNFTIVKDENFQNLANKRAELLALLDLEILIKL